MKKKKVNSKRSYKKGGEAWVSEKMANLPMYQVAGTVKELDYWAAQSDEAVKRDAGIKKLATFVPENMGLLKNL